VVLLRLRWVLLVLAATGLTVAAGALGTTVETHEEDVELDTTDVTCKSQASCEGPSATAEASVGSPGADGDAPDRSCVDSAEPATRERCEPGAPETSSASVSARVGVSGIGAGADDDGEMETHDAAAPEDGGDGLFDNRSEGALILGALGLGASGMAAWIGLKRLAALLVAPLASRLQRGELLENDKRRAIYEEIQDNPGVNLRGLAEGLDLAWGTLLHHLRKLEDNHLITSDRYGKYRRFFLNGSTYSEDEQERLAALSTPSTARVAEYILENPGANQSEIGDAIGVTASTILFHVRRLKEVDLVEQERDGRYVHYYPNIQDHEAAQMATA